MATNQARAGWQAPEGIGGNNFDFLRLLQAVLVIFSHSFDLLKVSVEPFRRVTRQTTFGGVAVDAFFIISGYLVTHSWFNSRGVWQFTLKRIRRIYPGFIVATVFCSLVVGPFASPNPWLPYTPRQLVMLVAGCLGLRGDFHDYAFPNNPSHAMNASTWSIPYEARCYGATAALALLGVLAVRSRIAAVFFASLLVCIAFEAFDLEYNPQWVNYAIGMPSAWAHLLPCYLAGTVFYLFRQTIPHSTKWALVCALGLAAGAAFPPGLSITTPTFGTYLLFWVAYHPALKLHDWGQRFGDLSYGTYLYAFPIQQLLIYHVPLLRDAWSLFFVATLLALAAGFASWHLVEKRFLSPGRRHRDSRVEARGGNG